jgi:hypothetical protein
MPLKNPNGMLGFVLALSVCAFTATTFAKQISEESATVSGNIIDDSGRPVKDATVFVYSARLKQGYAIVCPTCWVDCGKRADTDAHGQFSITGLNSALKFGLLFVKQGFTATAKGGVDPAQGPLQPVKLTARIGSADDSKIVRGRVTDVAGNPIAGALIEPVAATLPDGGRYFGTMDWIDPLAATNTSGEFEIVATKTVNEIMLKISPRDLAPKLVSEPPGPSTNSIVLTQGATIMGRLVEPNGTPIAHAEVVMTSHDHANSENFSDMRVGTDSDGSFAFTNVPTRRIWGVYPTVESLKKRNLTASPYWCETVADRQVVNVGRLTLRPGYSVTGKIELLDKKDVPVGMHVSINADWTVGRLTDIAPDGTFEFTTLAPGIYSLNVGINGYTPTADSPHELLVERDRPNVIIHMARSP